MSIINEALKKASKGPGETQDWPGVLTPLEIKPKEVVKRFVPVRNQQRSTVVLEKTRVASSRRAGIVLLSVLVALGLSYLGVKFYSKGTPLAPVSTQSEGVPAIVEVHKFDQLEPAPATVQEPAPVTPAATLEMEPVSVAPTPRAAEISQKKSSPSKKIPKIQLTGIMMGDPPQALVNGHFVQPGDHLGEVKVVRIEADHVTFRYQGRKFKKWIY